MFYFCSSCSTLNGFMKDMKEFGYHKHQHTVDPVKHLRRSFWRKCRLKVFDYFRKRVSILDVNKYAPRRRMKIARYVNLYFASRRVPNWYGYHFKSCFIILLNVLRLNPNPLRLQLKFLALLSTCNVTTAIVSSVLAVLVLSDLSLYFFTLFHIFLFVGGSFSGNLQRKPFSTSR